MSEVILTPPRNAEKDDVQLRFQIERPEGSLATWVHQATPGTTYWRCYLPAMHLPGECVGMQGLHDVSYDDDKDWLEMTRVHSPQVIWQFMGDEYRARLAFKLQDQGTPTWHELDDNYINRPPTHLIKGGWSKTVEEARQVMREGKGTGYSHEQHRYLVGLFDGTIVSTDYLADKYYSLTNGNIHVCPNSVDPDDWNVERSESESLRIGYYASAAHNKDWPYVKKAVKKLMREKDVEFFTIGYRPPGYGGKTLPWEVDMFKARANLGHLDVGIAPLDSNAWALGKSDVKALEYAMAGVLPVVQGNAAPYSPWHGWWDFTPSTPQEWEDTLMDIVRNRDMVKAKAAEAKEYVLRERTIQGNIHLWREALGTTA